MGYLPHTMVNFLTLLGWSLDDKTELFSTESLIANFSIERVSKAGAIFNTEKLDWMNGHYIREMSADELAGRAAELLAGIPAAGNTQPAVARACAENRPASARTHEDAARRRARWSPSCSRNASSTRRTN